MSSTAMSRRTLALLAAVVLLPVMLTVLAEPARARAERYSNPTVPAATERQIANDVRFRRELGLRADPAYVRALYEEAQAGTIEASTTIGAIATPTEEALVQRNTAAVDAVSDVADDYFEHRQDIYGGMWIDQARGFVGIAVTQDLEEHRAALTSLIGDSSADVQYFLHRFSVQDLYAFQREIDLAIDNLLSYGVDISSTSIDEENNVVWIGVASDRTGATQVISAQFPGVPVHIEYEPHPILHGVDAVNSPPFRGGQRIQRPGNKVGFLTICTSGFVTYVVERAEPLFRYTYYLVTAGHCELDSAGSPRAGAFWTQVTTFVGVSDLNAAQSGSAADALRIAINPANVSGEIAITSTDNRKVQCMMTTDVKQGQVELMSGATSGSYTSGRLRRTNATVMPKDEESGVTLRFVKQHVADYTSRAGDSGGSVFGTRECSYRAQGIESAGDNKYSYYSPIFNVTKVLGLSGVVLDIPQ